MLSLPRAPIAAGKPARTFIHPANAGLVTLAAPVYRA